METVNILLMPSAWIALLTLVSLEIVLGIDNIMFLSLITNKLPVHQQKRGRTMGLGVAMMARILLLFGISFLMKLTKPLLNISIEGLSCNITGQSIIILSGGLFLLYKSVSEIHEKLENIKDTEKKGFNTSKNSFFMIILQIIALDIVFSLDSVLTAVGMVSFDTFGRTGAMAIMTMAIIIAVIVMLAFSGIVSKFVNDHPSIQMLALAFLILISVTLLVEAGHLSHLIIFDTTIEEIPKGYIYFAIGFSLLVEIFNIKQKKVSEKRKKEGEK
jgi:predicted tellurium resistance membrane protein TerC